MRKQPRAILFLGAVLCGLLILVSAPSSSLALSRQPELTALSLSAVAKSPLPKNDQLFGWQLANSKVVDAGQTVKIKQGVLTTGFTVESTATAASSTVPIQNGTFRMTLTAFSPAKAMPGQQPGRWYVQGVWTIVDEKAANTTVERRHDPDAMRGTMVAELDFNPATDPAPFAAVFRLPMSIARGRWTQGMGTFAFDANFEGTASMSINRRPDVLKALEK